MYESKFKNFLGSLLDLGRMTKEYNVQKILFHSRNIYSELVSDRRVKLFFTLSSKHSHGPITHEDLRHVMYEHVYVWCYRICPRIAIALHVKQQRCPKYCLNDDRIRESVLY